MEYPSCFQAIKQHYSQLTPVEKRIADYILTHAEDVMLMSIGELTAAVGVVKSAVVRCCKSLGYHGYAQFKLALAAEIAKNKQLNYAPYIYPEDNVDTILDKVFAANVKALHDTAEFTDRESFHQAVEILQNARHIYVYGIGTSSGTVLALQYRLMQLGYAAFAFTDPPSMKVSTMNLGPSDVAIGVSHSGRTIATLDALKLSRDAGAKTVCITSYPQSPIAQACDISLDVYSDEIMYPVEAMSAIIAQMSLIFAITVALSAKNYEKTLLRAKHARELINSVRLEDKSR